MVFRKNKKIEKEEKPPKKKSWLRYLAVVILLLLVLAGFIVYRYAQKSALGEIKAVKPDPLAVQKENAVPEVFAGKYLTFLYSPEYVLKTHEVAEDNQSVILERAYLSEKSAISKKIGLMVRSLPSHNLDEVPDYRMRETMPEKYRQENFSAGNVQGVGFVPADGGQFEKNYFLLHNDYLAILTITAPALPDETLNKEADAIAKSISWLK